MMCAAADVMLSLLTSGFVLSPSVAPAGAGLSRHCPGISAHYISRDLSKRTARMHVYRVRRRDVARGHGLWRSRVNHKSVEARSVHSHLCLPGLLLVSAGASGTHREAGLAISVLHTGLSSARRNGADESTLAALFSDVR